MTAKFIKIEDRIAQVVVRMEKKEVSLSLSPLFEGKKVRIKRKRSEGGFYEIVVPR